MILLYRNAKLNNRKIKKIYICDVNKSKSDLITSALPRREIYCHRVRVKNEKFRSRPQALLRGKLHAIKKYHDPFNSSNRYGIVLKI